MTDRMALKLRVMGRVQGVAFRNWTRGQAQALGVDGWVCNNPDGSVSALVVGPEAQVEHMVDRLWQGPGAAAVRDVTREIVRPIPDVSSFEIIG